MSEMKENKMDSNKIMQVVRGYIVNDTTLDNYATSSRQFCRITGTSITFDGNGQIISRGIQTKVVAKPIYIINALEIAGVRIDRNKVKANRAALDF